MSEIGIHRVASGDTNRVIYFQRQTGLSSFTVYQARNGAAWVVHTTPTIAEDDSTNAPGIYAFLIDQSMTVTGSNITEGMAFYVTHPGMQPVFLQCEIFKTPIEADIIKVAGGADIQASGTTAPEYAEP